MIAESFLSIQATTSQVFGKIKRHMRCTVFVCAISILMTSACVDRLSLGVGAEVGLGITIDGYISDQPGPYEIKVYSIYNIETRETLSTPISVKSLIISDNRGNAEVLKDVDAGIYQTSPSGIRGVVGSVYKMRVELFDGRIYESLPDTLLAPGSLDSLYLKFNEKYNVVGTKEYNFDVFFDGSYNEHVNNHFLWGVPGNFSVGNTSRIVSPSPCTRRSMFLVE